MSNSKPKIQEPTVFAIWRSPFEKKRYKASKNVSDADAPKYFIVKKKIKDEENKTIAYLTNNNNTFDKKYISSKFEKISFDDFLDKNIPLKELLGGTRKTIRKNPKNTKRHRNLRKSFRCRDYPISN